MLPAHTSGKTQPLDVTVFSASKAALNDAINIVVLRTGDNSWDSLTFCRMLTFAYGKSFTLHNIKTGFRRAGLFPLNSSQLLSIPRTISHAEPEVEMEVDELEQLFEEKRLRMCDQVLGEDTVLMENGFLDTAKGAVLTSTRAMDSEHEKYKQDRRRRIEKKSQVSELAERAARCTTIA